MDELFTEESLKYFNHPSDAWESWIVRKDLRKKWSEWLSKRQWRFFLTLTFRDVVYPNSALKLLNYLVRILNREVFGKHYTNYVGHSYFSYVASIEYQKRDVIHFHVLIDRPINFEKVHRFWNKFAGFAKIDQIKNNENAVYYVTKYITKTGEMALPYFAKKIKTPPFLPDWWKEQKNEGIENNSQ